MLTVSALIVSGINIEIWKFRLTFWLGNSIRSFSYGFGLQVKDLWTLRPGFYSEFRYKSYEHSGLVWRAIFPQTVLALRGSHGVALVPGISCTLWSGSTAEPPRTSALDKCSGSWYSDQIRSIFWPNMSKSAISAKWACPKNSETSIYQK